MSNGGFGNVVEDRLLLTLTIAFRLYKPYNNLYRPILCHTNRDIPDVGLNVMPWEPRSLPASVAHRQWHTASC